MKSKTPLSWHIVNGIIGFVLFLCFFCISIFIINCVYHNPESLGIVLSYPIVIALSFAIGIITVAKRCAKHFHKKNSEDKPFTYDFRFYSEKITIGLFMLLCLNLLIPLIIMLLASMLPGEVIAIVYPVAINIFILTFISLQSDKYLCKIQSDANKTISNRFTKKDKVTVSIISLVIVGLLVSIYQYTHVRSDYNPRFVAPISTANVEGVEVVPTLDTPMVKSGNVVWCGIFQVAWNHACDDMFGGPLQIENAELVTDRLNNSLVTKKDLPPDRFFTAAGRIEDGIVNKIKEGMADKFPDVNPYLPEYENIGLITYGYLNSKISFTTPFVDNDEPLAFVDGEGKEHYVRGFGLHEGDDFDLEEEQRSQVKVLFSQADEQSANDGRLSAFALDLTADQEEQIIIAVMPRPENLDSAFDDLSKRMQKFAADEGVSGLKYTDKLDIPNVAFNLRHEFTELQGVDKLIKNSKKFQGLFLAKAFQSIQFRLDKSGATVVSEMSVSFSFSSRCNLLKRHFIVDRPFLVVMKQRSADKPYFVAWIDNVEFLEVCTDSE